MKVVHPKVTYGAHVLLATSTPNSTAPHQQDSSLSDNYQQILPGCPTGLIIPNISSNEYRTATVPTVICTLCNRVITNMDKYMQDAEKVHESNDNYLNAMTRSTNKSPVPDDSISKPIVLNQDQKDTVKKYQQVKQPMQNTPESLGKDTSTSSEETDNIHKPENLKPQKDHPEESLPTEQEEEPQTEDTEATDTAEDSEYYQETDDDRMSDPSSQYRCSVTRNRHRTNTNRRGKSLEQLSSFSDKQAVLELYHMLSVLDQYLYDNPSQHTYCMSPNNEFVVSVKHTLQINTDITEFPKIWAILSILLDTQDSTLQYVQYFQHAYNEYYKAKSHKQIRKLEAKCIQIQNCLYDSIQDDFDRVSDHDDNGPTPLQRQEDEQPQAVNAADKTIDSHTSDIIASYVKWSTNIHDMLDTNDIDDTNRQEIQRHVRNNTPVKMRDNRLFINDVDSYNRDIAMINRSLSDRLGLGHTSVPGAQQVIPIGKFNDQGTYIQNYLRESRLAENARNIYSDEQN